MILNAKTCMTVATQTFSPGGRDRMVVELSDPKINQRPSDRDQLLAPDLSGLYVDKIRHRFLAWRSEMGSQPNQQRE